MDFPLSNFIIYRLATHTIPTYEAQSFPIISYSKVFFFFFFAASSTELCNEKVYRNGGGYLGQVYERYMRSS